MNRRLPLAVAASAIALAAVTPAQASDHDWATASDVGVLALTALAIGLPAVHGDGAGALQAAGSEGAAGLTATGLKELFPERRPDGSNNRSFPSGHTAVGFAAAASIYEREGPGIGIPAFAAASFVGLARVEADKHHWYDCAVGAGIGTAAGLLITNKHHPRSAMVVPWGDAHGGGVSMAMAF
ncbi:phosphatase PAP2 family protein [Novosphingobium sp. Gsoil 351]|uniref:phosphatase PAP2 family protein n=1 Tax=Novosphingobium sp. Gsoil 351 TaxID=2675225 RepID=UPI0012B4C787|nr:phosphatase PAP2 family protein [Novosphingobium sp. Gsoil 351]QGN54783.1 phosphatase PAP2 family protein [Novosphingobium sp. Gsoil 351]